METIIVYLMYFTIENPDIKLIKDLSYTRRMLEKKMKWYQVLLIT